MLTIKHARSAPPALPREDKGFYEKWQPEHDALLFGESPRVIAKKLGITRNAVIGRRFRLRALASKEPTT